jgi:hypothetical protein
MIYKKNNLINRLGSCISDKLLIKLLKIGMLWWVKKMIAGGNIYTWEFYIEV